MSAMDRISIDDVLWASVLFTKDVFVDSFQGRHRFGSAVKTDLWPWPAWVSTIYF